MTTWLMWAIAALAVLSPVVLMLAFNRDNISDSRGRRLSRRWHS